MLERFKKTKDSNSSYVFMVTLENGSESIAIVHSPSAMYDEAKGRLKRQLKRNKVKHKKILLIGQSNSQTKVLIYGI